ncbi:MAG: DUF5615 family PIN-like protein [Bacteroidota bacterium]
MTLADFNILTDENISDAVVLFLRSNSFDVLDVKEKQWMGYSDHLLLKEAYKEQRVILTHDSDFGKLVFTQSLPFIGIVYLRPGHFSANVTVQSIRTILQKQIALNPPFMLIAENNTSAIKIRYREVKL